MTINYIGVDLKLRQQIWPTVVVRCMTCVSPSMCLVCCVNLSCDLNQVNLCTFACSHYAMHVGLGAGRRGGH